MNNYTFKKSKYPSLKRDVTVDIECATNFSPHKGNPDYYISFQTSAYCMKDNIIYIGNFTNFLDRDQALLDLNNFIQSNNNNQLKTNSSMKQVFEDVKGFVKEHRNIIYIAAFILLVDHFFLGGKLVDRIKGIVEKLLTGVEKKVSAIDVTTTAAK